MKDLATALKALLELEGRTAFLVCPDPCAPRRFVHKFSLSAPA
jgi:hypothetical protein